MYDMHEYTAMVLVSCMAVTLILGGLLRPFPNVSWFDFLKYGPIVALLSLGGFIFWIGRRSPVRSERVFFMALTGLCVVLAALVAYSPVLEPIQVIFWFMAKILLFLCRFIR